MWGGVVISLKAAGPAQLVISPWAGELKTRVAHDPHAHLLFIAL